MAGGCRRGRPFVQRRRPGRLAAAGRAALAYGRVSDRRRVPSGRGGLFLYRELALRRAAHRADPRFGKVIKRCSGRYFRIRIALFRIVDVSAHVANVLLHSVLDRPVVMCPNCNRCSEPRASEAGSYSLITSSRRERNQATPVRMPINTTPWRSSNHAGASTYQLREFGSTTRARSR